MKPCDQCGKPVEKAREDYVVPVCFACLPPPGPLTVIPTRRQLVRRIEELDLHYQAALADLAMLQREHQKAQEHLAILERRVEGCTDSYARGRASALAEVVALLEEDLEDQSVHTYATSLSALERIKRIKP